VKVVNFVNYTSIAFSLVFVDSVHTTLLYISLLLLALSLDIESNPGPIQTPVYLEGNSTIFLCGRCEQPVTWSCKGVECDACFLWYHSDCQNINNSMYDRLGESPSKARVWKCLACDYLNITTKFLSNLDSYETSNPYEPLDTPNHSNISFSRIQTYTPKSKQQYSSSKKPLTKQKNKMKRSVKVLVVNCHSIVDKKKEYENLIHSTKPDVVIGTESWLKPKHLTARMFGLRLTCLAANHS